MFSVESKKFDAKRVVNCSRDQLLVFCLEGYAYVDAVFLGM